MSPDSGEPIKRRPTSVLFVCGMNAVRSPMAAAIARALFPSQIYVRSAGVRQGVSDPFVDSVMAEVGMDTSQHKPKTLEDLAESGFDLVITLAPEAHHAALEMTRTDAVDVEYWPTMDPTLATGSRSQILDAYRGIRTQLMARIKKRLDWTPPPSG
ncbi:low molecular weight phosphatase family protein [Roseibium limicola]